VVSPASGFLVGSSTEERIEADWNRTGGGADSNVEAIEVGSWDTHCMNAVVMKSWCDWEADRFVRMSAYSSED
jgi:hypothetical protein